MKLSLWLFVGLVMGSSLFAQPKGYNYEEAKVPEYTLPELLLMADGTRVKTVKQWETQRRPEI